MQLEMGHVPKDIIVKISRVEYIYTAEPLYKGTLKNNLTLNNSQRKWNTVIYYNKK